MGNYITIVSTFLLAAIYLYATFEIPVLKNTDPMGPRAYPILLGIALAVSAGLLLVESIRAKRQSNEKAQEPQEAIIKHPLIIGVVIVWTIVFILLFEPLGYIVSTALYLFPLMIYGNPRKLWANSIVSVFFPVSVYILFVKLLGVTLPKGMINW